MSHPTGSDQFPVRCNCCGTTYDALAWATLPLVGVQDDGADGRIELRNCPCGSTISVELEPERFAVVVPRRAHRGEWLEAHVKQLDAMARVTEPPPASGVLHPAVALFEAARARAMAPRLRIQPGRISSS